MNIKNIILDILFPKVCINCKKEGKYICDKCELFISENSLICPVCGNSNFTGETHFGCKGRYSLDGLISIWDYDGLVKKLIYKIKYDGLTHAIDECVENSFKLIARDINRFYSFLSFLVSENTHITYVPMFRRKEKQRGFNQSKIIAKKITDISNKEVVSLIEKIINIESQTKLKKEERFENVKAAFVPLNGVTASQGNVLLVDDVFTTGATMKECCKVLKQAGIKKVWGFVLARDI